jgi:uncharacterized protein YbaR (Trm112 family)
MSNVVTKAYRCTKCDVIFDRTTLGSFTGTPTKGEIEIYKRTKLLVCPVCKKPDNLKELKTTYLSLWSDNKKQRLLNSTLERKFKKTKFLTTLVVLVLLVFIYLSYRTHV